jgi:aminopeptidase
MNDELKQNLEKYAEVIVKVGLNLHAGQRLMIGAPFFGVDGTLLEIHPLVREIAKVAYQAGAKYVAVNWDDEELQRIRVQNAALDTMDEFATWKNEIAIEYIESGDAMMGFINNDPDLMNGLDAAKVQAKQRAEAPHFHRLFSKMATGTTNWLAVTAATANWARKIFPDLSPDEAVTRLWETIFKACRVDVDDPIAAWEAHLADLDKRSAYLNDKQYKALKYTAPGTDLTVGLPQGHNWHSGRLQAQNGIQFVANIPTDEVFTLAHKDEIDGVVSSTKPLAYASSVIDKFTLEFSEGRVVNAKAEVGQDALDNLLSTDEASRSLGEVALVPHSSPISQSGLLFYNILYDENASCHLALGNAYRFSLEGGEGMTAEEFAAAGGNESMTHADFMIGSGELDIDGVTNDGQSEPLMRTGEWAFEV